MHISSVIKISFCRISFSGHQNKFCACLGSIYGCRVILVMCKNCIDKSWHRLNLNQSKTNCPKNLNYDRLIVREMGPWPECIFCSLLQFLVIILSASPYSIDPSSICLSSSSIFFVELLPSIYIVDFPFFVKVFFLGLLILMFVIIMLWSVTLLLLPHTFFPPSSSSIVYVTFWAMYLVVNM